MNEPMPCHITDGPQTPEDVDHGCRDEPEYDKNDDPYWGNRVREFLSRDIKLHVCKDGTITYRRPGSAQIERRIVHIREKIAELQKLLEPPPI